MEAHQKFLDFYDPAKISDSDLLKVFPSREEALEVAFCYHLPCNFQDILNAKQLAEKYLDLDDEIFKQELQSQFEKELREIEERIFSEEKIAYQKKSQLDKTKNFVLQNKGLLGSFNARISEQLTVLQDLHTQKMDKKSDEWFDVMNGKNVQPPYTAIE